MEKEDLSDDLEDPMRSVITLVVAILVPSLALGDMPESGGDTLLFHSRRGDAGGNDGSGAVRPSLFTGAAEMSIPIVVPAAAAGAAPSLGLSYSSRRGRGNAGVGWALEMPKIARSTKYGHQLPRLWTNATAIFEYGGEELVRSNDALENDPLGCASMRYYRKKDSNQRFLFCETNNYWTVTNKDGGYGIYGKDEVARVGRLTIFEWHLQEQVEPHGARWKATFTTAGNHPRLDEIRYALDAAGVAIGGASHERKVTIAWEARPDVSLRWHFGEEVIFSERIANITVYLGANRVRKYVLTYATSDDGASSLLESVQELGTDDTQWFPATYFGYSSYAGERPGFDSTATATFTGPDMFYESESSTNSYTHRDTFDLDGDGYLDHIDSAQTDATSNFWKFRKGLGTLGFAAETNWRFIPWKIRHSERTWGSVTAAPMVNNLTIDMTGDGLPDALGPGGAFYENTGTEFAAPITWSYPGGAPAYVQEFARDGGCASQAPLYTRAITELVDVTGDGCADRLTIEGGAWKMYRNQACDPTPVKGFASAVTLGWTGGDPQPAYFTSSVQDCWIVEQNGLFIPQFGPASVEAGFVDLNDDGLVDYKAYGHRVYWGTGSGFVAETLGGSPTNFTNHLGLPPPVGVLQPYVALTTTGGIDQIMTIDINHDGRSDVVRSNGPTGSSNDFTVYLNEGDGFRLTPTSWPAYRADAGNARFGWIQGGDPTFGTTRTVDMNGDGTVDFVREWSGSWSIYAGATKTPELLTSVSNGIGGVTTLTWGSTVGAKDSGNLPFALPVLTGIEVKDGLYTAGSFTQTVYTTTISYSKSYFDRALREFSGFEKVTVLRSDNVGSATSRSEHVFATGKTGRTEAVPLGKTSGGTDCTETWTDDPQLAGLQIGVRRGPATGPFEVESWTPWEAILRVGVPSSVKTPQVKNTRHITRRLSTLETKLVTSTRTFDAQGNPTAIHDAGESIALSSCTVDPSVGGDERSTLVDWASNTPKWAFAPSEVRLCADQACSTGSVLRHRRFYYDFDDFGNYTLGQILDGDLSRKGTWVKFQSEPEQWANTTFTVDEWGNVAHVSDPIGDAVSFVYGASKTFVESESVTVTRNKQTPLTLTWSATWNENIGAPATTTDPNLRRLTWVFDKLGRVMQAKSTPPDNPAGSDIVLAENVFNLGGATGTTTANWIETKTYVDAIEFLKTKTYLDGLGRPVQSKAPGSSPTEWITRHARFTHHGSADVATLPFLSTEAYTSLVLDETTPPQKVRQTDFDWAGRPIEVELRTPAGQSFSKSTASYDRWVTATIDPRGLPKRYTRDAFGRLVSVQEGDGGSVVATASYAFDRAGNLVTITDANGNATQIKYDSRGQQRLVEDPNRSNCGTPANCPIQVVYGLDGSLSQRTDAKGQTTDFFWDELGRLYKKDFGVIGESDVFFNHDGATNGKGRLQDERRGGTNEYELSVVYDNWGRITNVDQGTNGASYSIEKSFDWLGRVTTVVYPTNEIAEYGYGLDGAVKDVSFQGSSIATVAARDAFLRRTTTEWGNGLVTYASFGSDERLETLVIDNPVGGPHLELSFTWDANGNPTQIENSAATPWTRTYGYDWANRLTSGSHVQDGQTIASWTFEYDKIGNITFNSDWGGTPGTPNYQYGSSAGPAAVTSIAGGYTLSYDENGALTSESLGAYFEYNSEGRVAGAGNSQADVDPEAKILYDGGGERRVFKTYHDATNQERTVHYVGAYFEKELVQGSPQDVRRFILLEGERVAVVSDQHGTHWLHGDHQGSISLVTAETGEVLERRTYGPFGNPLTQEGDPSTARGYSGAEEDREIGQIHLGVREHHFAIARWISPDPIIPDLARPQSLNPYSYVENRPSLFIDPSGYAMDCKPGPDGMDCTVTEDRTGDRMSAQSAASAAKLAEQAARDEAWMAATGSEIDMLMATVGVVPAAGGAAGGAAGVGGAAAGGSGAVIGEIVINAPVAATGAAPAATGTGIAGAAGATAALGFAAVAGIGIGLAINEHIIDPYVWGDPPRPQGPGPLDPHPAPLPTPTPGPLELGPKNGDLEGNLDQLDEIEKAQDRARQNPGGGKVIDDISKTKQRARHEWRKIRSIKDFEESDGGE